MEGVFAKKFSGAGEFRCRRLRSAQSRACGRGVKEPSASQILISGLLGLEASGIRSKGFLGQRRRSGCATDAAAIQRKAHLRATIVQRTVLVVNEDNGRCNPKSTTRPVSNPQGCPHERKQSASAIPVL